MFYRVHLTISRFGLKASANFPVTSFLDTCGHLLPIISEKERFVVMHVNIVVNKL
jgi:hypothetical protein